MKSAHTPPRFRPRSRRQNAPHPRDEETRPLDGSHPRHPVFANYCHHSKLLEGILLRDKSAHKSTLGMPRNPSFGRPTQHHDIHMLHWIFPLLDCNACVAKRLAQTGRMVSLCVASRRRASRGAPSGEFRGAQRGRHWRGRSRGAALARHKASTGRQVHCGERWTRSDGPPSGGTRPAMA